MDDVTDFTLARIRVLDSLDKHELRDAALACEWRRFAANEVIVAAGRNDRNDVFFVTQGSVRVAAQMGDTGEIRYGDFGPGSHFGDLHAFDPESPAFSVTARTDCVLGLMSFENFGRLVFDNRYVAIALLKHFAQTARKSIVGGPNDGQRSEVQLILSELLRRSEPDPASGGWTIPRLPRHRDLAAAVGANEDSVTAAIAQLIRLGLARRIYPGLQILDRTRVRELTEMT